MRFALKDKDRQAKLDSLCDENKFSEELQETCREKLGNNANFVCVHFGKIALKNAEGGKYHFSEFNVRILKSDIEVIENLKPNIWHPREKFDGNPEGLWMIQVDNKEPNAYLNWGCHRLAECATHFMYVVYPPRDEK